MNPFGSWLAPWKKAGKAEETGLTTALGRAHFPGC